MNKPLALLIAHGIAQGLTPGAIVNRIEKALLKGDITMEQHLCVDCHEPMELFYQGLNTGKSVPVITCKNKDCTLYGVTLSTDQYAGLTAGQLEGYRKMVAQFRGRNRD